MPDTPEFDYLMRLYGFLLPMNPAASDSKRHQYQFNIAVIRKTVDIDNPSNCSFEGSQVREIDPEILRKALMARAKELTQEQKDKNDALELARQLELGLPPAKI